ncbi:hypothetical protein SEUCBS139899_004097 [Sporothrix eucalyptigena]|uniref:Zn(2)-C6 fungal-type domain-containing protein n=1 Tax=Sporothrix eucalyptigena TaxID=1812306 RepID=A0ABP0BER5_9PEZI
MELHLAAAGATAPPSIGIPAPYGRACANCSRAKCRCIYRSNGNDCERCHRLNKECRPSIPVRRKAATSSSATKRSSSSTLSRTAQLEQKLDGLVSLLEAQTNSRVKAATATASTNVSDSSRGSTANGHTSPIATNATSTVPDARRAYLIPNGSPTKGPDEFRPMGQGGPDFGCGIVPHSNRLPLGGSSSSASSRTATTETRASSVSLRDVSYDEESGLLMASQCVGTQHMPRTPESSTSSSGTGGGYKQQKRKQQDDQQPPLPHQQQQQQQGLPIPAPPTLGWGFSCFTDTPRPRELGASATDTREQDGGAPRDMLNLDPSLEPTPAEADQSFHTFRSTMLPYFPYVYLPPDLTAVQLRRNRPVLWLAIMSITCQRVPTHTQLARSTHLRALFAHRVVFESEKSLDLLQALLAFLTWVHYTSKRDRPTLSVMSQLAVSLVYDLGLHKTASPCKSLIARLVRDHYQQSLAADDPPLLPPLLDERRAALAAYVLTSKFSIALKRCEPLKWTTRLEEHLHELAANAETPLDHVLATQVRLQRLADHIHQGEWQLNDPAYSDLSPVADATRLGNPESRLLPPYVVRVVRAKIDEIHDNIPPEARNYDGVLDALYAAEMMLCAGAVLPIVAPVASMASIAIISVRARSKPLSRPDKPLTTNTAHSSANGGYRSSSVDFARVAALERCVEAVANFWAFFRQITSGSYAALPFAFFAHFTHCVVLLYGLSVIDEPNWDRAAVRDRLHVLDMLDGFISKLRDAPRVGPGTSVTGTEAYDVFNRAAIMLSSVRDLWATDMGRPDHRERSRAAAVAAASAIVSKDRQDQEAHVPQSTAAAVPPMPPLGNGPMTLDAPASTEGTAWQLTSVAAAAAAPSTEDMPMGDTSGIAGPTGVAADPMMLPSTDEFFADLSTAMIPDDYMFWELFLDGLPQSQL